MSKKTFFSIILVLMISKLTLAIPNQEQVLKNELLIKSPNEEFSLGFKGKLNTGIEYKIVEAPGKNQVDFKVGTARLIFYGIAVNPQLKYFLQLNLADDSKKVLHDYYFNYVFKEYFKVQVGKFLAPFLRQNLATHTLFSSEAQPVIIFSDDLRSVGGMVLGNHLQFEWALAVLANSISARAGYNYGDIDGYDFSDFDGGPLRFSVAGNYFLGTKYTKWNLKDMRAGADFLIKYMGFASNGGFYYHKNKDENKIGLSLDGGYLIKKQFEPIVRYSWLKPEKSYYHEIMAGFNYYIFGRNLSLQAHGKYQPSSVKNDFSFGVEAKLAF